MPSLRTIVQSLALSSMIVLSTAAPVKDACGSGSSTTTAPATTSSASQIIKETSSTAVATSSSVASASSVPTIPASGGKLPIVSPIQFPTNKLSSRPRSLHHHPLPRIRSPRSRCSKLYLRCSRSNRKGNWCNRNSLRCYISRIHQPGFPSHTHSNSRQRTSHLGSIKCPNSSKENGHASSR